MRHAVREIARHAGFPADWRKLVARGEPFVARGAGSALPLERVEALGGKAHVIVKNQTTGEFGRARLAELARSVASDDEIWYSAQQPVPACLDAHLPRNPASGMAGLRKPNFWLGSARAHTTLHQDHMNNLVFQLAGAKRFTLFAPDDDRYLYRKSEDRLRTHSQIEVPERADVARFPLYRRATPIQLDLKAGDIFFMPAYWWHEVRTVDASLMLNYWWPPTLAAIAGIDLQAIAPSPSIVRHILLENLDLSAFASDHDVVHALARLDVPAFAAIVLGDIADALVLALAAKHHLGDQLYPETARAVLASSGTLSTASLDLLAAIRAEARAAIASLGRDGPHVALSPRALERRLRRQFTAHRIAPCVRLVANNRVLLHEVVGETYV